MSILLTVMDWTFKGIGKLETVYLLFIFNLKVSIQFDI